MLETLERAMATSSKEELVMVASVVEVELKVCVPSFGNYSCWNKKLNMPTKQYFQTGNYRMSNRRNSERETKQNVKNN